MDIEIVQFPLTRIAVIEHFGAPELEENSVNRLIAWRKEQGFFDTKKYRSYGIHYTNPNQVASEQHHVDFAISVDAPIETNSYGVINKIIPALRCAKARDIGSRANNKAIIYLLENWLPQSGEQLGNFPPIFHYINVDPTVSEEKMITDVYLPLK